MGVDPALCVGVEDSLNGVRAIHAAAMRPVMIPDMIAPTPEVEALLWRKCRDLSELQAIIANAT
jgi:beta-phosphoglucomutase-like phosphatase (HAD superfamily)